MGSGKPYPIGVTVISIFFLLVGVLVMVGLLLAVGDIPWPGFALGLSGCLLLVISGGAMLSGRNWGRQIYIALTPLLMIAEGLYSGFEPQQIIGVMIYLLAVFILTRRSANDFFETPLLPGWMV